MKSQRLKDCTYLHHVLHHHSLIILQLAGSLCLHDLHQCTDILETDAPDVLHKTRWFDFTDIRPICWRLYSQHC